MSNDRVETESPDGLTLARPSRPDRLHPGFAQLKDHPELIPVLTQAINEVIKSNHINRDRQAALVENVEWAAAAAALITYQRMAVSALRVSDAADGARRARAESVAVTAEVIADRVTDAAAEVSIVEEASAAHLVLVAASAAAELAASVGVDDETTASVAAALVVKAVSEAAAVTASARADAASNLAQAAAEAATDAAKEAATTALAAELEVITDASDRHRSALETCYEVATVTAQAELTRHSGEDVVQPRLHQPVSQPRPA